MNFSENPDYGFAIGRVRALEVHLIDRSRYERLVQTRSSEEFLAALAETNYGRGQDDVGRDDAAAMFSAAATENYAFFLKYCIDQWLVDIFRFQADAYNFKVLLKHALGGSEAVDAELLSHGTLSRRELDAVVSGATDARHVTLSEAAQQARATGEPALVDILVDRATHDMAVALARPNTFVSGYLQLHADIENLRTLVRSKAVPVGTAIDERAFLDGGTINRDQLKHLAAAEWSELAGRVVADSLRRYVEEGVGQAVKQRSLLRMERLGREMELSFLRRSRYAVLGLEPLVTFFLMRENELRNLRQLHAAKMAGFPDQLQRELVAYVD